MALEVAFINLLSDKKQVTSDMVELTIEIPNHKPQITNKSETLNLNKSHVKRGAANFKNRNTRTKKKL